MTEPWLNDWPNDWAMIHWLTQWLTLSVRTKRTQFTVGSNITNIKSDRRSNICLITLSLFGFISQHHIKLKKDCLHILILIYLWLKYFTIWLLLFNTLAVNETSRPAGCYQTLRYIRGENVKFKLESCPSLQKSFITKSWIILRYSYLKVDLRNNHDFTKNLNLNLNFCLIHWAWGRSFIWWSWKSVEQEEGGVIKSVVVLTVEEKLK